MPTVTVRVPDNANGSSQPNEYSPLKIRSLLMNCKTQKGVGNV